MRGQLATAAPFFNAVAGTDVGLACCGPQADDHNRKLADGKPEPVQGLTPPERLRFQLSYIRSATDEKKPQHDVCGFSFWFKPGLTCGF